jgi:hypothetical protein
MDRVRIFVATLVLAMAPVGTVAAGQAAEGRLIDLTADAAGDVVDVDPWFARHVADLRLCGVGETPGPALLGTFRIGAVILSRSRATAEPSARIFSVADDSVLLNAADLSLGTNAGLDITLLTAVSDAMEVETRFFSVTGGNTSRTVSAPAGVRFEGFGTALTAGEERTDYASRLYNFELNVRPRVAAGMPLVAGFRTLQLHERFELSRLDAVPATVDLGSHTNNFLYGVQVGAEPYLMGAGGPLTLEGVFKAGVYANHALQGTGSPPLATSVAARQNRAAFVGEVGLMIDYRFSRFLALRGGYELLWVSRVALAPNQSGSTDLLAPSASLNDSATAFYQGAVASLEFVF